MTRKYSSTSVEQLLNATIGAGDTTLSLASSAAVTSLLGGVTLAAGNVDQFTIVIDPDTASEEVIFVRGTSGSTLTGLVRGQAGTSATSHTAGATIKHVLTSNDLDFYTSGVDNALTAAGAVTLTNKTIALGSNTVSGTTAQFNAALTDGDFTTLAGTETLTNKNLTSSSNTFPSTLVTTTGTQTLSSKDLTATSNTFPSTLVTTTGTQTLTNKTIDYNSNTISNLPASTSQTLLSTTTLSGASTTISSISGSYNELYIYIYGVTQSSDSEISIGFNGSMTILSLFTYRTTGGAGGSEIENTSTFKITRSFNKNTSSNNSWLIKISNYTAGIAGNYANLKYEGGFSTASTTVALNGAGHIDTGSTAINQITITTSAGTFSGGTVKIYGIK